MGYYSDMKLDMTVGEHAEEQRLDRLDGIAPITRACDRCHTVGWSVRVRRLWGQGSDTPLCQECWQQASYD